MRRIYISFNGSTFALNERRFIMKYVIGYVIGGTVAVAGFIATFIAGAYAASCTITRSDEAYNNAAIWTGSNQRIVPSDDDDTEERKIEEI